MGLNSMPAHKASEISEVDFLMQALFSLPYTDAKLQNVKIPDQSIPEDWHFEVQKLDRTTASPTEIP